MTTLRPGGRQLAVSVVNICENTSGIHSKLDKQDRNHRKKLTMVQSLLLVGV